MKRLFFAVLLTSVICTLSLAQGKLYEFNADDSFAYNNLDDLKKTVDAFKKLFEGPGGESDQESQIKIIEADRARGKLLLVDKGTECVLLEDHSYQGGTLVSVFIKGKGLVYTIKNVISPKEQE
jgi:hypothetical protein